MTACSYLWLRKVLFADNNNVIFQGMHLTWQLLVWSMLAVQQVDGVRNRTDNLNQIACTKTELNCILLNLDVRK